MAIINIESNYPNLSDHIITKLMSYLVNSNKYIIVERHNLEILENELNFNMSGMVSDETAQRIGRMTGAQSVITGNISSIGDVYRLVLKIIEVETATVQGIFTELIMEDQILLALVGRNINLGQSFQNNQRNTLFYWLYFGIKPSFGIHFYNLVDTIYNDNKSSNGTSFDLSLQITIRPFQYFAIQIEPIFTADSMSVSSREYVHDENNDIKYYYDTNYIYKHHSLLLPILMKGIFDYKIVTFSGLAGGYISLPLGNIERNNSSTNTNTITSIDSIFGIIFGLDIGIKFKYGNIFFDIRYAFDLSDTFYNDQNIYKRSILFLGLGYEIGFFPNTKRRQN
jgi:hypothetical protein